MRWFKDDGMQILRKSIRLSAFLFLHISLYLMYFTNTSLSATIYPQRTGSDGHFKTWLYRTNGIYYFEGYYQHPVQIEFASDEKIETIYLPKPNAWSITTMVNMMLLTPIVEDAETTMTVMTNRRTYYFEMHPRTANGAIDKDVPYNIKFRYTNTHDATFAVAKVSFWRNLLMNFVNMVTFVALLVLIVREMKAQLTIV